MDHNEYKETLDIYKQEHLPVTDRRRGNGYSRCGEEHHVQALENGGAAGSSDWESMEN